MQQRQPRLGDILDDYCPRERRITNHAVVAMIDHDVKQTRCTTCDAEHEYKHAKVPAARKKKTGPAALYDEVLTGMPRKPQPVPAAPADSDPAPPPSAEPPSVSVAAPPGAAPPPGAAAPPPAPDDVEGPVHRQLIRATLPRPEGQPKERPIPEFTARTAAVARPGRFRPHGGAHGQDRRGASAQGTNGHQGGFRFGRRGPGGFAAAGSSGGHGNRARPAHGGQGQPPGHGSHRRRGKKRSK